MATSAASSVTVRPEGRRRTGDELGEVVATQRLELEHRAATEQRADDRGPRALGGRPDERDDAGLDRRQQRVLLGAGEAVDLVEEEDGAPLVHAQPSRRLVDRLADVLHGRGDGGQRHEHVLAGRGHQAGDRGLPGPR